MYLGETGGIHETLHVGRVMELHVCCGGCSSVAEVMCLTLPLTRGGHGGSGGGGTHRRDGSHADPQILLSPAPGSTLLTTAAAHVLKRLLKQQQWYVLTLNQGFDNCAIFLVAAF